jgi:hypothetical protein
MILNSPYVSGSLTVTGNIIASGSITLSGSVASASFAASASNALAAQTASFVLTAQTASFIANAQSASNAVAAQTSSFANAFTVAGTLTAQTLVVQTITSSVDFVTGSTRFGSILDNTHIFSGSVTMNPNGLFVSSSGNVGVGTPTPSAKLEVNGYGVANSIMTYVAAKFYGGGTGGVNIGTDGTVAMIATDSSDADMQFLTRVAGVFSPRITIKSGGSIGIGTTNPTTKLTIESSTYDDFIKFTRTSVGSMGISATSPRGIQTTDGAGNFIGWHVNASGSVGIGTTNPSSLIHINSGTTATQTIANFAAANYGSSSNRIYIQIGTQYEDGSSRIGSINTTGNQSALVFQTHAATSDVWNDAMYINGSGNIGIGTTSPTEILQANGSIRVLQTSNTGIAQFATDASNTTSLRCGLATFGNAASDVLLGIGRASNSFLYKNGGTLVIGTEGAYPLILSAGDAERMRITNTGLVGIGVTNPQAFVDTSGFGNLVVGNGGSGDRGITIYSGTTGRGGLMFADATTGSGGYIGYILYNHSTDTMEIATSSVPRLSIKSDGRTWIGGAISGFDGSSAILQINSFTRTSGQMIFHNPSNVAQAVSVACNGADSFNVAGAFSANSKSFLIPHPLASLESTHNLRYVSVESPQADLIYRGKLTLINGKAQANIDEAATMTEGTFEALCREVQCFTTNETGWDLVKGKVIGNIIYIESQNTESTDEISWLVIGERKDKHMMDTSWTDENGKVIVEPLKQIETVEQN